MTTQIACSRRLAIAGSAARGGLVVVVLSFRETTSRDMTRPPPEVRKTIDHAVSAVESDPRTSGIVMRTNYDLMWNSGRYARCCGHADFVAL